MSPQDLSERAKAVVLLCSTVGLGGRADVKPFGPVRWHSLRRYIEEAGLGGPEALVGLDAAAVASAIGVQRDIAERVARLFERAGRFSLDMERIAAWGIWVLTEFDEAYPDVLTTRLGDSAPPLLFGGGDRDLLRCKGVAVVGSRRPDDAGGVFARQFGATAAELGLAIISGAARGVDETAMSAAVARGGIAVGVVADSLERLVRRKAWRERLLSGELVLVSEHHPSRRFDPGWAMQRNRVVYCLSRAAVVVASDAGRGGTWEGATKNAKAGWVPLFVREAATAPAGNRRLLETLNARALPDDGARAARVVKEALAGAGAGADSRDAGREATADADIRNELPLPSASADSDVRQALPVASDPVDSPEPATHAQPPAVTVTAPGQGSAVGPDDVFPRVAAFLVTAAVTRQKVAAVAEELGVPQGQTTKWLARAVDDEFLVRKSKRYAVGPQTPITLPDAVTSPGALLAAGIAVAESLDIAALKQKEAVDRLAAASCVETSLAKIWLAGAAAKLSQPLFVVDEEVADDSALVGPERHEPDQAIG